MLCNIFRVNLLTTWQKFHGKKCLYVISNIINGRTLSSITTPDGIEIRKLQKDDVPQLVKNLLPPERWNLNENDFYFALEIDPDGSIIAINEKGKILGSCSTFNLDIDTSIGLVYWINEEYQNRSFGLTLLRIINEHIGDRNLLISGLPKYLEKFEFRSGFKKGEIVQRFSGKIKSEPNLHVNDINFESFSPSLLDKILKYDNDLCLNTKSSLLKKYLTQEYSLTLLASKNGKLCGYGAITDCVFASKIQPLFADDSDIAKLLIVKLSEQFPPADKNGIWLELPIKNESAIKIATSFGLTCIRTMPYMFMHDNVLPHHPKIYTRYLWHTLKHN